MPLLKNGIDLSTSLDTFISRSTELFIFTPYVKVNTLRAILDRHNCCKVLVVRWQIKDLLLGASDLEIYDYCKNRGITLFFNQRLHLKAYVDNFQKCLLGSANISSNGLDLPSSNKYNYELATIVNNLDNEDQLYFQTIIAESILVTQSIYNQIKEYIGNHKEIKLQDESFIIQELNKNFLIACLPMTTSPSRLINLYTAGNFNNQEERNCVLHDLALYNIPFGLNLSDFSNRLKNAFFMHPFIHTFLEMIKRKNGQIFFGEAKNWIQTNCTNVPVPRRWELTTNTQILYTWIVELGDGAFAIDRPNYSERLFIVDK